MRATNDASQSQESKAEADSKHHKSKAEADSKHQESKAEADRKHKESKADEAKKHSSSKGTEVAAQFFAAPEGATYQKHGAGDTAQTGDYTYMKKHAADYEKYSSQAQGGGAERLPEVHGQVCRSLL